VSHSYFAINGAPVLATAGWMCIVAAALHFGCIWGGAEWYRTFGAGEELARAAKQGSWVPHIFAGGIGAILLISAAYAFAAANTMSGFGIQASPPFPRLILSAICAVLLGRGLLIFVPDLWRADLSETFKFRSSVVVLIMAATFIVGTWQAWPHLSQRTN
jgi:hypothetical protein